MRSWIGVLLAALALGAAGEARAVTLSLVSSDPPQTIGGSFQVDVLVSGLGAGAAPSLGSYDLDIAFDASVVAFTSASFAGLLGVPGVQTFHDALLAGAGVLDLFEVSLLSPAQLDALQGDSFLLASLDFEAVGEGMAALALTQSIAGDGFGAALPVATAGASLQVVPEPSAALLVAGGLLGLACRSRRS